VVGAPLGQTRAQSRYGVAYLRALSAQAGFGLSETAADEDVLAVDCTLDIPASPVRVQVKCTTKNFGKTTNYLSFHVEDHWRAAWEQNLNDLYFVVIGLRSKVAARWVTHPDLYTHHDAIAYWARIRPAAIPTAVRVHRADRLTATTIADWEDHLLRRQGG
jgi:Domain of unknown function (DUF4365)